MQSNWETLSFEDRQKQWEGEQRVFQQNNGRADRNRVWTVRVAGDRVHTTYGLVGGEMQQADYQGKVKNKSRANEISAEVDALAEARRDVKKKWDMEGYDEYVNGQNIDHRNENISVHHLLTALPGSFCLYKPENTFADQKKLVAKAAEGKVFYTLKRNGFAYWVIKDYHGNINLFSRRSRPWSDSEEPAELPDGTTDYSTAIPWANRFPHLVESVKKLNLPNGTMMACELCGAGDTKEDFTYVSGLTKGYTARALEDMRANGLPVLYWWDVPFYNGQDLVSTWPVRERFRLIDNHVGQTPPPYIEAVRRMSFDNPEVAIEFAKANGLEGFVVIDPDSVYGDKGWNLKGKPDRPATVAKLKPWFEDDFVLLWDPDGNPKGKKVYGEWGIGRHEKGKRVKLPDGQVVEHGGVGSVGLWQYNKAGELVFISKCSGGMDYEFQAGLRKHHFPMVAECKYTDRSYMSEGDDTNALTFPGFVSLRTDKAPEECINDRL